MERAGVHELTAAYALDALDAGAEREYEEHLAHCPECRDELASLQLAAASLAYAVEAPPPPPALRARILEQARAERTNVAPLQRPRRFYPAAAAAASAIAAAVAIGVGIWAASLSDSLDRQRALVAVLADPAARTVPLTGAEGKLVLGPDGEAVLSVARLAPAPEGKTYEAWVIEGGAARPAGLFEGSDSLDSVELLDRRVPRGAQVAVTVERDGGVDAPTGKPVLVARA